LVPKPQTSSNKAAGLFDKQDFVYLADKNEYRCPAGPDGHFKFPHLWSPKFPRAGRVDY
jgi:hypothetical protein